MSGSQAAAGIAELESLAAELGGHQAYAVTLLSMEGRRPCLRITNRQDTRLTEYIYAAPDGDGTWWFWWGWAQRIADVADLAAAAAAVDRVLRVFGGTR